MLKRILYILFLTFNLQLLTFNSFAQSITWQRTYDGIDHVSDGGFDVCKADGDNIYVAGYTTFLPNRKWIYVLKLNPYGDTIWTRAISLGTNGGETANAIASSGDGGCVITGDAGFAFAIKLDASGSIVWNKNYGGTFKQYYNIIKTSDGGYIACGRDAEGINDDACILKIDSLGNLQWQRTYYSTYWMNFHCIEETNNSDGYIVAGFNINSPTDTAKSLVVKINLTGDTVWTKKLKFGRSSGISSISGLSNGYIIAGGSILGNFFARINESGDTTFVKVLQGTNLTEYFGRFEIINPNRYVIASSRDSVVATHGHVTITDSVGNIIADRIYMSSDYLILKSVLPLPNGDIVFIGGVDFDAVFTREDVYALRTDSLLNAPPPIGIENQNLNLPDVFSLSNYPNPFNPVTKVKYTVAKTSNIKIIIYDISGKEVAILVNQNQHAGNYHTKWNAAGFASGIYFLTMVAGGIKLTKKLVLVK